MVKSPYNFVPLAEEVFFPSWASQISQDMPFSDGESGMIRLRISAQSDIFVSESIGKQEAEQTGRVKGFSKTADNRYFIPGSSLKGTVRSVLQILSFSKLNPMEDVRYAMRDLQSPDYKGHDWNNVHGGWLKKEGDTYLLQDIGKPGRISHKALDAQLRTDFGPTFRGENGKYNGNKDDHKAASFKIAMLEKAGVAGHSFRFSHDYTDVMREIYKFDSNGSQEGKIICTGQPSKRVEPKGQRAKGKHLEFIFWNLTNDYVALPEQVVKDFLFVYYDHDKNQQSEDYKYWGEKLKKGEKIPVFFSYEKGDKKVAHMGLSFMYKLPYRYRVAELLPQQHKSLQRDMTECLFGYAEKRQGDTALSALKGRVQFGHAFACGTPQVGAAITAVLGTPRASYYPFYLEQKGGYLKNYFDGTAKLSGYKRYPMRKQPYQQSLTYVNGEGKSVPISDKTLTSFTPLKAGTAFECEVRFHNLRPMELGALLSALTFHGQTGKYFHGMGMGKPLGYGRCTIELSGLEGVQHPAEGYMKAFELGMKSFKADWAQSAPLRELLAMSQLAPDESALIYPALKEFIDYKRDSSSLKRFSELTGLQAASCPALPANSAPQADAQAERFPDLSQYLPEGASLLSEALKQLETRIVEVEQAREAAERAERETARGNVSLELPEVKKFELFKKHIENNFLKKRFGNSYEKTLQVPFIPEEHHTEVLEALNKLRPQDKKPFEREGAGAWAALVKWLGEDKARNWFQQN